MTICVFVMRSHLGRLSPIQNETTRCRQVRVRSARSIGARDNSAHPAEGAMSGGIASAIDRATMTGDDGPHSSSSPASPTCGSNSVVPREGLEMRRDRRPRGTREFRIRPNSACRSRRGARLRRERRRGQRVRRRSGARLKAGFDRDAREREDECVILRANRKDEQRHRIACPTKSFPHPGPASS